MAPAEQPAKPDYFDHNATTPLDPRVLEAMLPYFREHFGNPESVQHPYGWKAKNAVEAARAQVALLIGASANEIYFTSGATESIYLSLHGYLATLRGPQHIITSEAEHKATLEAAVQLKRLGHEVSFLPVNRFGQVEFERVKSAVKKNTALISLMHANNEVGSLNPIAEIGAWTKTNESIVFHVDAAQTAGKLPLDVRSFGIDLLSLSAHKFHGPKGVGALYVRRPGIQLQALMAGGGQERGLRGGTLNVPGIVGLGHAAEIALDEMPREQRRYHEFQKLFYDLVEQSRGRLSLNGHPVERIANNVHLTVGGIGTDEVLLALKNFALSTGSACNAGSASHVLRAMGLTSTDPLNSALRIGFGRFTTREEVDRLLARLRQTVS